MQFTKRKQRKIKYRFNFFVVNFKEYINIKIKVKEFHWFKINKLNFNNNFNQQ